MEPLSPERHEEVRRQVRHLLGNASAFGALPAPERRKIAKDLVQVLSFLSDPSAGTGGEHDAAENLELLNLVQSQAEPDVSKRANAKTSRSPDAKTAGDLLNPAAADQAGESYKELTNAVDFPAFVSGLVEGVFTSIVESSIKQMQEYGKFLEAIVKSLNDFKDENVSQQEGRESIMDRFPGMFDQDNDSGSLVQGANWDDDNPPDLQGAFGIEGELDLDDPEQEKKLVESARLKLARMRQQQLATMVLLGIHRIVVTDGHISAKVFIEVKSKDKVERTNYASEHARQRDRQYKHSRKRSWWGTSGNSEGAVSAKVSSAYSSSKDESESELKTKAQLTGSVRINFKSETFPLERIGTPAELTAVNQKSGGAPK